MKSTQNINLKSTNYRFNLHQGYKSFSQEPEGKCDDDGMAGGDLLLVHFFKDFLGLKGVSPEIGVDSFMFQRNMTS